MVGYIKLKTTNEELYETDFLEKLKEKNTKLAYIQYFICYFYYEFVVWIKYVANIITIKKIYHAYLFIFPFKLDKKKNTEYKLKRCMKKIQKIIKKYQVDTLVLSEELEKRLDIWEEKEQNSNKKQRNKFANR